MTAEVGPCKFVVGPRPVLLLKRVTEQRHLVFATSKSKTRPKALHMANCIYNIFVYIYNIHICVHEANLFAEYVAQLVEAN